ncbi:MAG: nucleoside-diphosphate kinase [Methermicoccaceae archaeon]
MQEQREDNVGSMQRTFVMVKPDGVQRGLVGRIISRFEDKGLKLVGMKLCLISDELAREHYAEHADKPFFQELVDFITSAPVVSMVLEGKDAVAVVRELCGSTDPSQSPPGSIRGDFGIEISKNIIHASDSLASAKREIALHFESDMLLSYERVDEVWIY